MRNHFLELLESAGPRAAQERAYGRARAPVVAGEIHPLGAEEGYYISQRDSFYLATVSEDGWPYIQHRGGPKGFVTVVDARTLAFADYNGNRQLLTTGHVGRDPRVALFLMDYAARERLKILGRVEVIDGEAMKPWLEKVSVPKGARAERVFVVHVEAFDWNCPKYITPRYTADEVAEAVAPLRSRIEELERALAEARNKNAGP